MPKTTLKASSNSISNNLDPLEQKQQTYRQHKRVLVIGAGPSGLVALKTLLELGYKNVRCVDTGTQIGGTFRNKKYDDGRLVSSKYITAFSDFRFDFNSRDHPMIDEYLLYLEAYCDRFGLWDHLEFNTKVEDIQKCYVNDLNTNTNTKLLSHYKVTLTQRCNDDNNSNSNNNHNKSNESETAIFNCISICSGLHNIPYIPYIENLTTKGSDDISIVNNTKFKGKLMHSINYKDKSIFKDKRVLIVGSGETGLDLVFRAVQMTSKCVLCAKSGYLSVPYTLTESETYQGMPCVYGRMFVCLFVCVYT